MSNDAIADETLMLRFIEGDAQAFEALYARHKGGVYRYFTRQCRQAIAEELFQDVWMRLVASSGSYRAEARFTTFLYRIAHNRLVDHFRSVGRRPETTVGDDEAGLLENESDLESAPDIQASRHELANQLKHCLDELSDPQREAFLLREEGGLGLEEIAQATNVGRETAKSRLRYAISSLRRCLERLS